VAARRPLWVWLAPFTAVFGVLLAKNAFLFTTPLHEDADMGAVSILIEQARRFTLLVGNYSREKFNHPGPAVLYVQSWGESLFWSVLHLVPTAWNGQLIALYALNALFATLVVATGYGWTRTVRGAVAVLAVALAYGALHPAMFSSDWMPYVYVLPYFAFLVAIASVGAGRYQDSWIAALSGWFLIHGHASFLFFVPVLRAVPLLLFAVAGAITWRLPAGPVRRFCVSLLVFDALSSLAFLAYTAIGIDDLTQYYIGYFYWSAPVITVLVIALGIVEGLSSAADSVLSWLGVAVAVAAAAAACAAFAAAPQTRTSTTHTDPADLSTGADTDPALPAGVARMAVLAAGRPVVLRLAQHDAWPAMTGVLVQAERTGVRACVADPGWQFMVTSQFICTPAELAEGKNFQLNVPGQVPRGSRVEVRLRRAIVTAAGI